LGSIGFHTITPASVVVKVNALAPGLAIAPPVAVPSVVAKVKILVAMLMLAAPEAVAKVVVITSGVAVAEIVELVITLAKAVDKVIGVAVMSAIIVVAEIAKTPIDIVRGLAPTTISALVPTISVAKGNSENALSPNNIYYNPYKGGCRYGGVQPPL
jgi:hypothetical protein